MNGPKRPSAVKMCAQRKDLWVPRFVARMFALRKAVVLAALEAGAGKSVTSGWEHRSVLGFGLTSEADTT